MAVDIKVIKEGNAPAAELWREHFAVMDVHINAEKPEELLRARRPKESEDAYILNYRKANFRHTAKSLFDRALDNVIESLQKTNIQEKSESDRLKQFLADYRKYSSGTYYDLKSWIFTDVTRYSEVDANGILVVLPLHENKLIPSFEAELPIFQQGQPIAGVDVVLVPFNKVVLNSESMLVFEAGDWTYAKNEKGKELKKPYYFVYTKGQLDIYYPKENPDDKKVTYQAEGYYITGMDKIPAHVLGNRYIYKKDKEGNKQKIFVSNLFSAALIGDLYYGEISDTQLIGTKYHPIRYQYKLDCEAGCFPEDKDGTTVYCDASGNTCSSCKGKGKIVDFAISDIYMMEPPTQFKDGTADIKNPIGWATPPAEVLKLRHEIDDKFYQRIAVELCLNLDQNLTNASEGSKQIDREYKVTFYSNIVEAKVSCYENILQFCEMLLEYKNTATTKVMRPRKYDVQSREDVLAQVSEMKNAGAPDIITMDGIRELLRHQYGFDAKAEKIIDFIMVKDRLITYGSKDLQQARALLGEAVITQRALDIHGLMYVVLSEVLSQNPDMELTYENLNTKFEEVLNKYAPAPAPGTNLV